MIFNFLRSAIYQKRGKMELRKLYMGFWLVHLCSHVGQNSYALTDFSERGTLMEICMISLLFRCTHYTVPQCKKCTRKSAMLEGFAANWDELMSICSYRMMSWFRQTVNMASNIRNDVIDYSKLIRPNDYELLFFCSFQLQQLQRFADFVYENRHRGTSPSSVRHIYFILLHIKPHH